MLKFLTGYLLTTANDHEHIRTLTAYFTAAHLHIAETIILHGTKNWHVPERHDNSALSAKCIFGLIVVHESQAGKALEIADERVVSNYFKVKKQSMTKIFEVIIIYF